MRLIDASLDTDPDGVPVLLAVYEHAFWPERTGLRRRLDRWPVLLSPSDDLDEWLAGWIAWCEMGEPLGRQYDLLVEDDDGLWWWGDGYPDLTEHPDYDDVHKRVLASIDAADLRNTRTAAGLSLEELAEASGINIERLRDAESYVPQADLNLTLREWLSLAAVFEGHAIEEYEAQAATKGDEGWVMVSGQMLEHARFIVARAFHADEPDRHDS